MDKNKDAFDLWWEWADKPVDSMLMIDAANLIDRGFAPIQIEAGVTCPTWSRYSFATDIGGTNTNVNTSMDMDMETETDTDMAIVVGDFRGLRPPLF